MKRLCNFYRIMMATSRYKQSINGRCLINRDCCLSPIPALSFLLLNPQDSRPAPCRRCSRGLYHRQRVGGSNAEEPWACPEKGSGGLHFLLLHHSGWGNGDKQSSPLGYMMDRVLTPGLRHEREMNPHLTKAVKFIAT